MSGTVIASRSTTGGVALATTPGAVAASGIESNTGISGRVAIFQSGAIYPDAKIIKMAISAASDTNQTTTPIPPCGSCRQSISEYEFKQNTPIEIYFMGEIGEVFKSDSIKNLLPLSFDKNFL